MSILIRPALLADLDQLVALEKTCFDTDQLSRRSFKHWITTEHRALLVAEQANEIGHISSIPTATLPPSLAVDHIGSIPIATLPPPQAVAGYILIIYHPGTWLARVYSLAVAMRKEEPASPKC